MSRKRTKQAVIEPAADGLRIDVEPPTTPAIDVELPPLNRETGEVWKVGYRCGATFTFAYVRAHDSGDAWQLVIGQNPGAEQVSVKNVNDVG